MNDPNTNKPNDNNELSQYNLKELYEIFQKYINSQVSKNIKQRMLGKKKMNKNNKLKII